ncbi:MAG: hypothetical protein ACRC62_25020 [Microcoleus sp.]
MTRSGFNRRQLGKTGFQQPIARSMCRSHFPNSAILCYKQLFVAKSG